MKGRLSFWISLSAILIILLIVLDREFLRPSVPTEKEATHPGSASESWQAPDSSLIERGETGDRIRYGRELIVHTSRFFGHKGLVAEITNGMNCQNCHLEAGARPYGNCFAGVAANYPQYRNRSGRIESIEFRVNDCMQRSLNGRPIDSLSKEMVAIVSYLKWLGKGVPLKTKPPGSGLAELADLNRSADTVSGSKVYFTKCQVCHGKNGEGLMGLDSTGYTYPPLWGSHSYNTGAGLYRLSSFAAYVKYNMPFQSASIRSPQLTDEQAWDVAAFVNSRPRPEKLFKEDWPDLSKKAVDCPQGPFADHFSAAQHKYGPFKPIRDAQREIGKK